MPRLKLHHWILVGMVAGALVGLPLNALAEYEVIDAEWARQTARVGNEIGTLFLRLLQMIVVPLIVSSLVSGVVGIGDLRRLGRVGGLTFGYYMLTSILAIIVGMFFVNLIRPGVGADLAGLSPDGEPIVPAVVASDESVWQILWAQIVGMIPPNPVAAAAQGDMLPIIFFSLMLGVFISLTGGQAAESLGSLFNRLFEVMMRMTMFVIALAPVGVFGFMLYATAGKGLAAFAALAWYMLTVFMGLSFHACVTLPLLLYFVARRSPRAYVTAVSPALMTAFSTASSNATLPLTMNSVETRAGISNRISSFVLPLGATINMDGSALYEAVAVLFIAQAYGADLTFGQQVVVAFTALLVSIGAAGIPHAGTVMMVIVLKAVGLPIEAVGLILAVDRVLDMCRTTVNVWSDTTAAAVVARYEPDLARG